MAEANRCVHLTKQKCSDLPSAFRRGGGGEFLSPFKISASPKFICIRQLRSLAVIPSFSPSLAALEVGQTALLSLRGLNPLLSAFSELLCFTAGPRMLRIIFRWRRRLATAAAHQPWLTKSDRRRERPLPFTDESYSGETSRL
jgi:hypothetical protein